MFDLGFSELLVIAVVALIVLGPERLPKAARFAGLWVRKARAQWYSVKSEFEREMAADELRRSLADPARQLQDEVARAGRDLRDAAAGAGDEVREAAAGIDRDVRATRDALAQAARDRPADPAPDPAQRPLELGAPAADAAPRDGDAP